MGLREEGRGRGEFWLSSRHADESEIHFGTHQSCLTCLTIRILPVPLLAVASAPSLGVLVQARSTLAHWLQRRQRCEALELTARQALQHPSERQGGLGRTKGARKTGNQSAYGRTLQVSFEFLLKDMIGSERVALISTPGGDILKLLK